MNVTEKSAAMLDQHHSKNFMARPCRGFLRGLLLFVALLALVIPLRADSPPTFVFEIDASDAPSGFAPNHIALDSLTNLYVTEGDANDIVDKFTSRGKFLAQWGIPGGLSNPDGIAIDTMNNVYVVNRGDSRIDKYNSNGAYLTSWISNPDGADGNFLGPNDIAADSSNNVYMLSDYNDNVTKYDSNGNYLTQWGSPGTNAGQFAEPEGIATDTSNNVYVTDSDNSRVEKFDSNGNYLAQWGSFGANAGEFEQPYGIAVDRSNNVYVTDIHGRVEKFDSSGAFLTQWGSNGTNNGQFQNPIAVAVDSSGQSIYVVDYRIQVFVNNTNIIPPFIVQQPAGQTLPAGVSVTLTVSAVGGPSLAYQWSFNRVIVPGATNAHLTLTNVGLSNSGNYYALVTNSYGSVLSSTARLAILPALVTTQPASGISVAGAVLNGSITVASDQTVAWFDWGTNTSYGNYAEVTIVPGENGSTNITATLDGLSGNVYHYRLVAVNDFGVVYGEDQSFTVGYAPTAATLAAVNNTNGATLNASVNPNGWDTSVYFQWGFRSITFTTPRTDIGAGVSNVTVNTLVSAIPASTPYQYQVVAINALGTAFGPVAFWTPPVSVAGQAGAVFINLHSFSGGEEGAFPCAALVQASDGYFYGTTERGGKFNVHSPYGTAGTVFKISTNGVLTRLYLFSGYYDGLNPYAGLVQGSDGYLYGTTAYGGDDPGYFDYGTGTAFFMTTNGDLGSLFAFGDDPYSVPGAVPVAGLVQDSDGNFYGTTEYSAGDAGFEGYYGAGTVFKISANGAFTSLYSFTGGDDGATPEAGLVQGSDGNFYGTTASGGAYTNLSGESLGTLFKISSDGTFTSLYSFRGTNDGANPTAALVQAADGSFYGTTEYGGTNGGFGTVFNLTTNGMLTTLHSFTGATDGANPVAALVLGSDGYLYGTTSGGGVSGNGTIFALDADGTGFTTLYSFSASSTNSSGVFTNSDGANPLAGLILSGNTIYGTASAGGSSGYGTVFSMTLPARPQLTIVQSGANVILTWPAAANGFTLEFATNLVSPTVWQAVSMAPVAIAGQNVVTTLITGAQTFFRLRY